MTRTIEDIRENMPHVGCDNETALEMCDEIERLREELRASARMLALFGAAYIEKPQTKKYND